VAQWSAVAQFTPAAVTTLPGAPSISAVVAEDYETADFTLTAPAALNVSHLVWQVSVDNETWTTHETIQTRPAEVHTREFVLPSGGTTGTTRWFRLAAVTAGGQGSFGDFGACAG
jgi:hypothetical protein